MSRSSSRRLPRLVHGAPPPRRKKPAFARAGSDDFNVLRPGTRIGERNGQKIMQHSRAEQERMSRRERPFPAIPPGIRSPNAHLQRRPYVGPRPDGGLHWPYSAGIHGPATLADPWPI